MLIKRNYVMKKSKYNFLFKMDSSSNYLLCNLLSGAVAEITEDQIATVIDTLDGNPVDTLLVKELAEEGYIVPDDFNEIDVIKYHYWKNKMDNNHFVLSVITSYNCDLNCVYCFQQENRKISNASISMDVLNRIPLLVKNKIKEGFKLFTICWDGGEATLSLDKILKVGMELKRICESSGVVLHQEFATNGFSLNEEKLSLLANIGITTLAITLAGDQKEHDKLRKTLNGKNTFEKILSNIKIAKSIIPSIIIIANVTSTNVESMYGMIDRLDELKLYDNVFLNFKRIIPYNIKSLESLCLTKHKYNKSVVSLQRYCLTKNIKVGNTHIMTPTFSHCLAGRKNSFTVDFNGNLYKCLECFDNPIGYVTELGELIFYENENDNVIDIFLDNKCLNCIQLPCCAGGCITKRMNNLDYCPSEIGSEMEYLQFEYDVLNSQS